MHGDGRARGVRARKSLETRGEKLSTTLYDALPECGPLDRRMTYNDTPPHVRCAKSQRGVTSARLKPTPEICLGATPTAERTRPADLNALSCILSQADELELLELQSVLLEHVLALKICLEASSIRHNPDVALEAVNGHFDLLRKATAVPVITSTDNEDLAEVPPPS